MKRTEKKLKSKGIKTHKPNRAHAYWCYKYDRNYVANHQGDVSFLPFSRGSRRIMWMWWDEHPNLFLYCYLSSFFRKHIGKNVDEVFREFTHLGWKHSYDMYFYWDEYVSPRRYFGYFVDESGNLGYKSRRDAYSRPQPTQDIDDDEMPKVARKPKSKRLTRKHLDHNESIIAAKVEDGGYGDANPGLLGEMFVEIDHKVVKRDVYLVKSPYNPCTHKPVPLLGTYKEERRFYYHSVKNRIETVFNEKEQVLEATLVRDNSESGELIPCI